VAAERVASIRGDPCGILPDDDLLRSKHVGVVVYIFMCFNVEININN